jgi:flagella basal body P-ring formation protein FlgA
VIALKKRMVLWSVLAVAGLYGIGASAVVAQIEALKAAQTDSDGVVVELRPSSMVGQRTVTLDAIANIRGGDQVLRQQIGQLDVVELPEIGKSSSVSREQVAFRIQLAGIDRSRFRVEGQAETLISLEIAEWTAEQVQAAAEKAIALRLGVDRGDIEYRLVQPVRLPPSQVPPAGDLEFAADVRMQGKPLGRVAVEVGIVVNKERTGSIPVVLEVACYQKVAVAARRLENGEVLQSDAIRAERMLVHGGDNYVVFADNLLGQHLLRPIQPGQVLTSGDIELTAAEDPVLVKTHDNVKLVANVGNMRITVFGEALQEGRGGQMIRVRNIDSNRTVVGRVVGRGTVEVEQ